MGEKPRGQAAPIREKVDDWMPLEVDDWMPLEVDDWMPLEVDDWMPLEVKQDAAVAAPAAEGDVVHAEHARRGPRGRRIRAGDGSARMRASRVSPQTVLPSRRSRRTPGSPPSATATCRRQSRKRSGHPACGAATPGNRSVKMWRGQPGVSQKKRRSEEAPRPQEEARGDVLPGQIRHRATVRRDRECTRDAVRPQIGQRAVSLYVRALRMIVPFAAVRESTSSRLGSSASV